MSTYSDLLSVLSLFIAWLVAKPRSEAVHCRFFFFFFWAAKPHGWCKNWLVVFTMYGNVSFDHNLWRCSIRLFDDHENINLRLIFFYLFFFVLSRKSCTWQGGKILHISSQCLCVSSTRIVLRAATWLQQTMKNAAQENKLFLDVMHEKLSHYRKKKMSHVTGLV